MRPAVAGTTLREIVCSLIVKDEFENPRNGQGIRGGVNSDDSMTYLPTIK